MSWAVAAGVAASAIGGLLSSSGGSSGGSAAKPFKKTTSTGSQWNELDIMFNEDSLQAMTAMTEYMGEIADYNQNFYRDTVIPFQQQASEMNTTSLSSIDEVNSAGLEQMTKDLMGNGSLQDVLQSRVESGGIEQGGLMDRASNMMKAELDNMPSLDERVGQALTAVEGQFSEAGKALAKNYASRGRITGKADNRSLAIEKAKAKSAAVGTAGAQYRSERLGMITAGLDAGGKVEAAGQQGIATATQGLMGLQESTRKTVGAAQDVLVDTGEIDSGLEAGKVAAGLTETSSQQEFGTRTAGDQINQFSKGLGTKGFDSLNEGVRNTNPQ